ncbi:inactive leucine-rich repeat receptor-like protein kinase CORYNE [Magnolia sinica]|uniref:inactive leucine-rich repeat receptor-like protein kinase CORYNE n=1 Tax=Magnolia sinica TaxID=86752 RepID=UPI002659E5D2|nr:inactive leucine-rich repeat receptor-like protein kinase CORYNE [Magnolia sinica]
MENRSPKSHLSRKVEILLQIIFLFCLFQSLECQEATRPLPLCHLDKIFAPSPSSPHSVPEFKTRLRRIILGIIFGCLTGFIATVVLAVVVRFSVQYMNRTPILKGPVIFSPKITPKTLQSALSNETQLLGSSPNGKYYRVVLDNELDFAIKRLKPFENGSPETQSKSVKRRIQRELEVLARLKHRNLMSLRAYVREPDRFSLVYDYMPNGSLEDAMNRVRVNQLQLGWDVRHRIAVGVIKGLRYLHFECNPRILHYNLKPTNIMLDEEFEPRLGDCGLANLMPNAGRAASAYDAPECFQNCRYTDKSDIFSFGVILGVLLTGRDPLDPFFGEAGGGGSLGRWLRHLQQAGEAREGLDKCILGEEVEEDEMLMAVRIAVVCLSDLPGDRHSSDELVPMLTQLHSF